MTSPKKPTTAPSLRVRQLEERQLRIDLWERSTIGSQDIPTQNMLFASGAKRDKIPLGLPLDPTNEHRPMRRPESSAAGTDLLRLAKTPRPTKRWPLQDAKACFSELVRRTRSEGPQFVTVHGRDEVVVVAADEFHRLKGERTGRNLIDALKMSSRRRFEIEPKRALMPVRDVEL